MALRGERGLLGITLAQVRRVGREHPTLHEWRRALPSLEELLLACRLGHKQLLGHVGDSQLRTFGGVEEWLGAL